MIISFSGRIGSGKDLSGSICKILLQFPHLNNSEVESYLGKRLKENEEQWEIKKFADKVKEIVCLLIGCSRDQLENESFKSKELGEEWWYWYMELDGGYSPIILDYLTTTKKELKNYEGLELIKPTIRFLLQFIGTNLFRNQLHPDIWVNSLMAEYKSKLSSNNPVDDLDWEPRFIYPNFIITDTRFENELEAVKKREGITIRVNRPGLTKSNHLSETSLDSATFDFIINNDKNIKHLINEVRNILIENKLIKNK